MENLLIIGIDPGLAATGFGIIEQKEQILKVIDYGCIKTNTDQKMQERLGIIFNGILKILEKYSPREAAVEEVFFQKNPKSIISLSHARGVILLAFEEKKIPVSEYSPLEIKSSICGYGRADKQQVQKMVKTILNLEKIPTPNHAADAISIAVCHSNSRKIKNISNLYLRKHN